MGIVYKVLNKTNGKVYIGQTVQKLLRRWNSHISRMNNGSQTYIHNAMRKYGVDNFEITEVFSHPAKLWLDRAEKFWIELFKSNQKEFGYNLTDGGEGTTGWVPSEEWRAKRSKYMTGRKPTDETKEKLSLALTGRKFTKESIEKRSASRRGKKLSPESVENIRQAVILRNKQNNPDRGLKFDKRRNKWVARMFYDGKEIYLGQFDTKEEAKKARLIGEQI